MRPLLLSALALSFFSFNTAYARLDFLEAQMQTLNHEVNQMMTAPASETFEKEENKAKMQSELEAFNLEFGANELLLKVYEGESAHKGEDKQKKSCMVGIAYDKESKKIRNFKILSNINFGIVDTAMVKSLVNLVNEKFNMNYDTAYTQEQMKERSNKYSYVSLNALPINEEQEAEIKKILAEQKISTTVEKIGEIKAGLYLDYKLEKNLLSKRIKTLSLEQGLQASFIKYSLINMDADYDTKHDQFKNFKIKAGIGLGINAALGCEKLKEI